MKKKTRPIPEKSKQQIGGQESDREMGSGLSLLCLRDLLANLKVNCIQKSRYASLEQSDQKMRKPLYREIDKDDNNLHRQGPEHICLHGQNSAVPDPLPVSFSLTNCSLNAQSDVSPFKRMDEFCFVAIKILGNGCLL